MKNLELNPALLLGELLKAVIPADLLADNLDEQISALASHYDEPMSPLKCQIKAMPDNESGYSSLHHDVKHGCYACSAPLSVVVYVRFERNPDDHGAVDFYGAYCKNCADEVLVDSTQVEVYLKS